MVSKLSLIKIDFKCQANIIICLVLFSSISCGKNPKNNSIYSSHTLYEDQTIQILDESYKQNQSKNIAALIDLSQLEIIENTNQLLRIKLPSANDVFNFCEENIKEKKAFYARCSPFVIGIDEMAMAAHCIGNTGFKNLTAAEKMRLQDFRIIFNSSENIDQKNNLTVASEDIYSIKKIKRYIYIQNIIDFVVFKVDRNIKNAGPFKINQTKAPNSVYSIGHHLGLPLSKTSHAEVTYKNSFTYYTYLPAFTGSSGGPVFDSENNHLIGLVASGPNDLNFDPQKRCNYITNYQKKIRHSTKVIPAKLLTGTFSLEELIIIEVFGLIDVHKRASKIQNIPFLKDRHKEMIKVSSNFSGLKNLLSTSDNFNNISFADFPLNEIIKKSSHKNLQAFINIYFLRREK